MLTKLTVLIVLQYMHIRNHDVPYLKLIVLYVDYISIYLDYEKICSSQSM